MVVLDFDLFVQMQSLLQPGSGCSSELERDGGDDPGRIISSYMVMMMVMVVGRQRARCVCVLISGEFQYNCVFMGSFKCLR